MNLRTMKLISSNLLSAPLLSSFALVTRRRFRFAAALFALSCGCGHPPAAQMDGTPLASPAPASSSAASPAAPLFDNILPTSGIDFAVRQTRTPLNIHETLGHGVALVDVDGDGLLDIVLVAPDRVRLYRNLGNYRFTDITPVSGLRQPGYWEGVAVGDIDNDGRPDLYLCGYNCSALYHNEGGGRFRDITNEAGLQVLPPDKEGTADWRTSALFADLDGDGRPDLYVCRYAEFNSHVPQLCSEIGKTQKFSCSPDMYKPQHGLLYRNLVGASGLARFEDITKSAGLADSGGRALAVACADYDRQGRLSLVIANDERPGDLFANQGGMRFVNQGATSGTAYSAEGSVHGGMGADWADIDGDGKLDLFVSTYGSEIKALYRSLGNGLFSETAQQAGLGDSLRPYVTFGCKFLDYDNDGWPDLMTASGHVLDNTATVYPGTQYRQPVQLFHNERGVFREVTAQMGAGARQMIVGRGLAVGDLNNTGHLDAVVTNLDGSPLLLKNGARDTNHWLTLHLIGTRSGRDAMGALVSVDAGGRTRVVQAANAGSFLSVSDSRVHVGLGTTDRAERMRVHWPDGHEDTYANVAADQFLQITEGASQPIKGL